jgi:hypothetical protein
MTVPRWPCASLYRAARRALGLVALHLRAVDERDVQILVLRYQLLAWHRRLVVRLAEENPTRVYPLSTTQTTPSP